MAPDLNSVPFPPRSQTSTTTSASTTTAPIPISNSGSSSRRVSQIMGPPPRPHSPASPGLGSSLLSTGDNTGVGVGPGPLRHPRPVTVADLHLELEKEQEAVVNRLTRELSLLRQQTASVASTTSSTSTSVNDAIDPVHNSQYLSGSVHPTSARRHRSSSNLSTRSLAGSTHAGVSAGAMSGSVNSIAPSRETGRPSADMPRVNRSRDPSVASTRRSGRSSPSLSSSLQQHGEHLPHSHSTSHSHSHSHSLSQSYSHSHRPSQTSAPIAIPNVANAPHHGGHGESHSRSASLSSTAATARYEEVAQHRAELAAAKRENDILRRRVRELEASLRERNQSSTGSEVSSSATPSSIASAIQRASLNDAS
ncbi:hypothetical protein FQN54_002816 [Arachnomyces sp. PD_36]|nr:hypothetical protein FQN54_002816 [Arachnomyces sp. PD_36]